MTKRSNASCLICGGAWTPLPPKNLFLCPKTTSRTSLSLEKLSCSLTVPIGPKSSSQSDKITCQVAERAWEELMKRDGFFSWM